MANMHQKVHRTKEQMLQSVQEAITKAAQSGQFMVAIWSVTPGHVHLVGRSTWQFPPGDLGTAVNLLRDDLIKEQFGSPMTAPLKHAPESLLGPHGPVLASPGLPGNVDILQMPPQFAPPQQLPDQSHLDSSVEDQQVSSENNQEMDASQQEHAMPDCNVGLRRESEQQQRTSFLPDGVE